MNLFIPIIIMSAMALATTLFSTAQYRQEDKMRMYDPQFKIVSYSRTIVIIAWSVVAGLSLFAFVVYRHTDDILAVTIMGFVAEAVLLVLGMFRRKSYYTSDPESLTYIKNGKQEWSYKWTDIAHVYRRIISTGKSTTILYDLTLKDGTVQKGLPQFLRRTLKEHVEIEHRPMSWIAIVIIVAILLLFIAIAMAV